MILIFSRATDASTTEVISWLEILNKKYVRFDSDEPEFSFSSYDLQKNEILFNTNKGIINLAEVSCVWYRRGGFSLKNFNFDLSKVIRKNIFPSSQDGGKTYIKNHINDETNTLIDFIFYKLQNKKTLSSHFNANVNKLQVLDIAKNNNLKTPDTIIVTTKKQVEDFLQRKSIINKALSNGVYFFSEKLAFYSHTVKIDKEECSKLPATFAPSLLQEQIEKKYEVRSFYLEGTFYSMAIFSQNNAQTAVDFRNYSRNKPNRFVPYKLPLDIEKSLENLLKQLSLNTGSIDLILDTNDEYVFLEVNPVGQFGMVSYPCNYYLEKVVANHL